MSWYGDQWKKRAAISAKQVPGPVTGDVDVDIPQDWDEFWDIIDASGNELRVTLPDGSTLLDYDLDNGSGGAFDRTNRLGRLRLDGATGTVTADSLILLWLYFDSETTQGDASTSVTMSGQIDGYIEQGTPRWKVASLRAEAPGSTEPAVAFAAGTEGVDFVWLNLADMLLDRQTETEGRILYEEPGRMSVSTEDDAGANASTFVDLDTCRWVESYEPARKMWLRFSIQNGADETNYTVKPLITTSIPGQPGVAFRQLPARFGVRVNDVTEPAP